MRDPAPHAILARVAVEEAAVSDPKYVPVLPIAVRT
jgi:hypothetical protein